MDLSISAFSSINFCFTYFSALLFGACTFRITMSSRLVDLYIIIWCPFLSLVNFLCSNITLSDTNIDTPAFFWLVFTWYIFFHPFTFNLPKLLYLKWIIWKQHVVGWYFLIHSSHPCFLIDIFRPFTFNMSWYIRA